MTAVCKHRGHVHWPTWPLLGKTKHTPSQTHTHTRIQKAPEAWDLPSEVTGDFPDKPSPEEGAHERRARRIKKKEKKRTGGESHFSRPHTIWAPTQLSLPDRFLFIPYQCLPTATFLSFPAARPSSCYQSTADTTWNGLKGERGRDQNRSGKLFKQCNRGNKRRNPRRSCGPRGCETPLCSQAREPKKLNKTWTVR